MSSRRGARTVGAAHDDSKSDTGSHNGVAGSTVGTGGRGGHSRRGGHTNSANTNQQASSQQQHKGGGQTTANSQQNQAYVQAAGGSHYQHAAPSHGGGDQGFGGSGVSGQNGSVLTHSPQVTPTEIPPVCTQNLNSYLYINIDICYFIFNLIHRI